MASRKQMINYYTRNYIKYVFEQRLREEGFTCPDDNLFCWYRINNNEIVNSVFFQAWSDALPVMLEMAYGIHPLYQLTAYIPSASYRKGPREESFRLIHIQDRESVTVGPYNVTDAYVDAPMYNSRGLYTLDGIILPKMQKANSLESCYELHKENIAELPSFLNETYIDEVIYFNDVNLFNSCIPFVTKKVNFLTELSEEKPNKPEIQTRLREWKERLKALEGGNREEYMNILEQRKQANISFMRKKLKLNI